MFSGWENMELRNQKSGIGNQKKIKVRQIKEYVF
jgi:hypothetical protein